MSIIREKTIDLKGKNYSKKDISIRSETYSSVNSFASDLLRRPYRFRDYDMKHPNSDHEDGYKACNISSYEEMLELLKNGYTPLVNKLRRVTKEYAIKAPKVRFANGVAGFTPVVPNALKNLPNSMVSSAISNTGKVLDVYYNNSMTWGYSAEDFLDAGERLIRSLVDLEKQGYRFNLYACSFFVLNRGFLDGQGLNEHHHNEEIDILAVKIKSSDKPLDLKRMSFPLSHPGWFRVAAWDWQGQSPITRHFGKCRGTSIRAGFRSDEAISAIIRSIFGDRAIFIDAQEINRNKEDESYVKNEIQKYAENLFGEKSSDKVEYVTKQSDSMSSAAAEAAESRFRQHRRQELTYKDLYGSEFEDHFCSSSFPDIPFPFPEVEHQTSTGSRITPFEFWKPPDKDPNEEFRRALERAVERIRRHQRGGL